MSGFVVPSAFMGDTSSLLPLVLFSLPIAFILSFAIGANDVANSFGTSYGSGVLSLRMCCILATIFETLGAITLGYNVSETIRKGIFEIGCYDHEEAQLALGYLSALVGSALWNLVATMASLPVSGTHSIMGSLLGFTLVAKALAGIKWYSIGIVVASWFVSPAASGFISIIGYYLIYKFVLSQKAARRHVIVLQILPPFFGITVFVNIFSILFKGPSFMTPFPRDKTAAGLFALGVSLLISAIVWLVVLFYWVPKQKKAIDDIIAGKAVPSRAAHAKVKELGSAETSLGSTAVTGVPSSNATSVTGSIMSIEAGASPVTTNIAEEDAPEVAQVFRSLQILTSCFGAFAHGANDVSNAIGPLIAVWLIYQQGNVYQLGDVPAYLLLLGGAGISAGLWFLGVRVIKTIGENLTSVTPSSGFTIELCSSFTVLIASKLGFPISTTHCKVGSVVAVGWIRERLIQNSAAAVSDANSNGNAGAAQSPSPAPKSMDSKSAVNWKLFMEIGCAWILTVPISAAFTAFTFWILRLMFPAYGGSSDCVAGNSPYYS